MTTPYTDATTIAARIGPHATASAVGHAARHGHRLGGWRIERRPATERDYDGGLGRTARYVYRLADYVEPEAAPEPANAAVYIVCDWVRVGYVTDRDFRTREAAERYRSGSYCAHGPPTAVLVCTGEAPGLGVRLRRSEIERRDDLTLIDERRAA